MTRSVWLIFLCVLAVGCRRSTESTSQPAPAEPPELAEQVRTFCGHCHAYPTPDTFPREHWRSEVERGYRFFEKSMLQLKPPRLRDVVEYYEKRAPNDYPTLKFTNATQPPRVKFEQVSYPGPAGSSRFSISHVNLVSLHHSSKLDVVACDMANGYVMLLQPYVDNPQWKILARLSSPGHSEVVDLDGDGIKDLLVADLGSYPPTDRRCGRVVWLRGERSGAYRPHVLLENVGRVADVQAAPFRAKGKLDLVVAVFGAQDTGEILFLENNTTDWSQPRFTPRVVDARHGTIHVPIVDLNRDDRPDFVALISQEHERVVAFVNQGEGRFEQKLLYEAPHPGYGSSGIQLVDFDKDGDTDVLYTNGDVLDRPYLYKPHHGIQWLENQGNLSFLHHRLTPLYGAHRAVAGDLDGDGKMDVVGVSFLPAESFPDRADRQPDAIVLLEQASPKQFARHVLKQVSCDHVSCALGDLTGSGRLDLVVGHFTATDTEAPVTIWKNVSRP